MSLHKDPELKEAVLSLPAKEKDKLLVRLIGKDKMLIKQLHFQLLEDETDLEERIERLRERLKQALDPKFSGIRNEGTYSNYKALMVLLRNSSGLINEHEKVTKDKLSEVEFRLFILAEAFRRYPVLFERNFLLAADKLHLYISGRKKITLAKYDKLHEDYQFDLREDWALIKELPF
ncbi:hypothetical protein ACL9RF_08980 [Sphingobacterium sp. Mn56C]|uniref:hypothetical protein n=1 Tax=Sphingobacterium sp. Mn56C TaxID=3395261 RepID=UPI003BC5D48A